MNAPEEGRPLECPHARATLVVLQRPRWAVGLGAGLLRPVGGGGGGGRAAPARRGRDAKARAGRRAGEGQGAPGLPAPVTHCRGPVLTSPPPPHGRPAPRGPPSSPQPRGPSPGSPLPPYRWPLPLGIFPPRGGGCGRPEVRRWRAGSAATCTSAAPPRRAGDSAPAAV